MRFLKDTFYDIKHFLFIVLILVAAFFILKYELTDLYTKETISENTETVEQEKNTEVNIAGVAKEEPIELSVTIPAESTLLDISKILIDTGIIKDEGTFIEKVKNSGFEGKLKTGEFKLKRGLTDDEVLALLKE